MSNVDQAQQGGNEARVLRLPDICHLIDARPESGGPTTEASALLCTPLREGGEGCWALTGQGSSQASPSQPAVHEQEPSAGLQAAPLAQAQLSLQFRPHVPLGHGRVQSGPCHPERGERVCQLSVGARHGWLSAYSPSSVPAP